MIKFRQFTVWSCCFVLLAAATRTARPDNSSEAVLHLSDGDFLAGYLADCDETGVVRWHMRGATTPFDFPAAAVRAAHFPSPESVPSPKGDYLFELANGDMLYGSLVSVTPERFEIETARFGRLHVDRAEIRRLVRSADSSPSEYRGPNSLAEWKHAKEGWHEEAGRLITSAARARVQKEYAIPEKARIEFEIAGDSNLEFAFILSPGTSEAQLQQGYRFEVWQRSLVALRELEDRADMTVVCELNAGENRVQIEALVDQKAGTMSIHAPNGKQLATIKVPPPAGDKPDSLRWITVLNGKGSLRFERLSIGRWSGQLPPQIEADKPGVCQTDGTVIYGDVIGYDADARQFVMRTEGSEEKRIDVANVTAVFLAPTEQPADYSFRIGLHDGTRYSGKLTKVAGDKVYVSRDGIDEPLACLVDHVRSIVGLTQDINLRAARASTGWLELDGVRSHGALLAATATDGNTCLVWKPRQSTTGSALAPNVSGRIVYRESAGLQSSSDPRMQRQRQRELQVRQQRLQVIQQQQFRGGIVRRTTRSVAAGLPARMSPKPDGAGVLYLLAGDRIPCESTEIDEAGVRFKSSVVDATFAPHSAVKALELVSNWKALIDEQKQTRLLTLPRLQKNNPPTHLVASTGGDILRANVVTLNAKALVVESRLETQRIPRDRVACLIWLHNARPGPVADPRQIPPAVEDELDSLRVQAVRADGVRLTFVPKECTGTELIGASELLGECQLELKKVDYLVLGPLIEALADELAFHEWKLTDAPDPRYVSAQAQGAAGDPSSAVGSGLIGKPAPDFNLDLLEGGAFQLSEQKGHVVVLDFWASWCGPCMQSLPQVDAVISEFAGKGVKLVAVNMQEDRATITSALERLKIKPAVAIDIDGAAAGHYQVTAIPHTVVIDGEGKIARLFIGSSPESAAQLRAALEDLLTGSATQ